jgi:large subunit ribosomal protein L2
MIPGTEVYNVSLNPQEKGVMIRAAGASAKVMSHEGKYTVLKMASKEIRKVLSECFASVGQVSHPENKFEEKGKAGVRRRKGWRPSVRGTAMNTIDHPHGGGSGKTSIGMKHPKTPWGKNAYGVKTRKPNKSSNKLIIKRRK